MNDLAPGAPPAPSSALVATAAPWWPTALLCLLIAVVVYAPAALGAQFLAFDDNFFFGPDNPEFRDGLAAVLDPRRPIANAYLPVAHLSLWFDFALAKASPWWAHLHALLLHALAAFVLVRLLLQLGTSRAVAHVAGALFIVHPALAESVAWVSGRKDLLSGLFVFAALHQTVAFARRPHAGRAIGLLLLAALAMYSKATAVVLPCLAALVCAYVPGPRARWTAVGVLLLAVLPIAWHHQAIAAAEGTLADGSLTARLGQVPGAFLHYLQTALWPTRLNVLYPEVETLARFRDQLALGSAVLAAFVLLTALLWWRPAWRSAGLGLAAFVVALLPFNTAFPASSIAAADRYLYLAIPGLALAVVATAARLAPGRGPWLAAALALPLAWLAGGRAHTFQDDATLWRTSLQTEPDNAVAHLNFVYDQLQRGPARFDEVRGHLEAAGKAARYPIHEVRARQLLVRLAVMDADYPRAAVEAKAAVAAATAQLARETSDKRRAEATAWLLQCQLAAFEPLQLAGDEAGAAACHEAARALAPEHPDVVAFGALRDLLACRDELLALAQAGKPPVLAEQDPRVLAAEAKLVQALGTHERHAGLLCARAEWERARGQVLPAIRWYRAAQAADPGHVQAFLGAARLMRELERFESAEEYAKLGLQARPDPSLRQELALALVGQGKLADAELQLEAYLRVHPEDKDTARVLSNVLIGRAYSRLSEGAGDRAEVQRLVERALAYNPDEKKAHLVLGRLAKEARQLDEAVRQLEIAYRSMPTYDEARLLYAESLAALGYARFLKRDEDAAAVAWRRCLDVAPAGFDKLEIERQLQRVWSRYEGLGLQHLKAGDRPAAAEAFRKCLALQPDQHWAAWLLATALHDQPGADLAEVERLGRLAIAWQERHQLDKSRQVLLVATTLVRAGRAAEGKALVAAYLAAPDADAKPQVLQALQRLATD